MHNFHLLSLQTIMNAPLTTSSAGLMSLPTEIRLVILLRISDWKDEDTATRLRLRLTCCYFYNLIAPPTTKDLLHLESEYFHVAKWYFHGSGRNFRLGLCPKCSRLRAASAFRAEELHRTVCRQKFPVCLDCEPRLSPLRRHRPSTIFRKGW